MSTPPDPDPLEHAFTDSEIRQKLRCKAMKAIHGNRRFNLEYIEELVDTALTRAWVKRVQYDPARPLINWLYLFMTNVLHEEFRKINKGKKQDYRPLDECLAAAQSDPDFLEELSQLELAKVMSQLKPEEQQLLRLRYVEDYSGEQIAEELKIQPSAARKRLNRALAHAQQIARGMTGGDA